MQPAGGRQAQARAGPAERHAFVGDHPEMTGARNGIAHRGGIHRRTGLHVLVSAADQLEQLGQAHELLVEGIGVARQVAHAHQFDETQLETSLQAVLQQRQHLIEILSAQRHHVDLDLHPGLTRRFHAGEHRGQVATPGDTTERIGIQGIERDVETTNAALDQQRQLALQQLAIGGQADVVEAELADLAQEGFQARADQRLTTGDTQTLDAGCLDQVSHATRHGVGREFVLCGDQALAVRHAVGARIIAGGGQADAEVAEASALAIDDHGELQWRNGLEYIAMSATGHSHGRHARVRRRACACCPCARRCP